MPKEDLTVLIIGSGGREHAISAAYERSPNVKRIIITIKEVSLSFIFHSPCLPLICGCNI